MVMRIDEAAGIVPFTSAARAALADFSSQTSALSFHAMPAVSQSARVKGCGLGRTATSCAAASQTLARSLHDHPGAFSQSARVKG
jgi:hypothetical protein